LTSLGYPPDHESSPDRFSSGQRLGLAVVLVLVTGVLLWQVAAMNGLVPSGPFARLFMASAAPRTPSPMLPGTGPGARLPGAVSPPPAAPGSERAAIAAAASPGEPTPDTSPLARGADAATSKPAAVDMATPVQTPRSDGTKAPTAMSADRPNVPGPQMPLPPPPPGRVPPTAPPASQGTGAAVIPRAAAVTPAVSRAPAGEADHFKLALYYQRIGDFENALVHYRALLEANELNAEAHNNLGLLYLGKGLYDEAIREFQRATFIEPRYDKAHNNLGVALLRSGKTDAAVSEFRGVVAQNPKNVEALTNLSLALKATGRVAEARETLQRALGINGRYAQAHYNLALIYDESGELQRAIDHYEQFLTNPGPESTALTVEVRTRVQALRAKLR
jgi:Tfp pilus assembly protein PilF